jgi:hypothetical protein
MAPPVPDEAPSIGAQLVARAIEELRLRADDFASQVSISRAEFDAWTLAPATMPFAVRSALGVLLADGENSDDQRELAARLIAQTTADASWHYFRFLRDELSLCPRDQMEARWNAYLASPLLRRPGAEPETVAQIAARSGVTVETMLHNVTAGSGR